MTKKIELTATQAIALHCYECMGCEWGNKFECTADGRNGTPKCFLFDIASKQSRPDSLKNKFFDGKCSRKVDVEFSSRTRKPTKMTEEQKKAAGERMRNAQNKKGAK